MSIVQWSGDKIGEAHESAVLALTETFEKIRAIAPSDHAKALAGEQGEMRDWRARIAAIGQVKAGKSTFLSALVGRPDFLPSEVNPWTTVITNMHFGHPEDPTAGAVFSFFAEEDWNRIIDGDDSVRELAEDLLPGFQADVLRGQVEEMRVRARKRLGRFYQVLLGREHRYDHVNRDILERYVCAGYEAETSKDRDGRYSDITERADLFFDGGPFGTPAVLTDTPGVNDPFLVRDEFTCRSLRDADIFILMLSAQQALSEVDIGLVRMLMAHPDKQILVFINRMDELEDYDEDAPRIVADVRARVAEIGAEHEVDVIIGSAHWANITLKEAPDSPVIADLAADPRLGRLLGALYDTPETEPLARLRQASGLPRLEVAIDRAISRGAGAQMLSAKRQFLSQVATSIAAGLDMRKAELLDLVERDVSREELSDALLASINDRSAALGDVKAELNQTFERSKDELNDISRQAWEAHRRNLELVTASFVEDQEALLRDVIRSESDASRFQMTSGAIREQLERSTVDSYKAAREKSDRLIAEMMREARRMTQPVLGDAGLELDTASLPETEILPMVATTNQTLTLELVTSHGWKFWKSTSLSEADAIKALKQIVRSEFYPAIEHLIEVASQSLAKRTAEAIRRVNALSDMAMTGLTEQLEQSRRESMASKLSVEERIGAELEEIDRRLALLQTVTGARDRPAAAEGDQQAQSVA